MEQALKSEQLDFLDPLQVELTIFQGPLQLLLELIRKKKMDIQTVPLSEICTPYVQYVNKFEKLNLNICGEFLSIAASLILIKSRTLLPKHEAEEEEDPEDLLRSRLIEFEHLKNVTGYFLKRDILQRDIFCRPEIEDEKGEKAEETFDITIFALIKAFHKITKKIQKRENFTLDVEEYNIEHRISDIIEYLTLHKSCYLEEIFEQETRTMPLLIITFMSLLELIHKRIITITQEVEFSRIECILCETPPEETLKNLLNNHA